MGNKIVADKGKVGDLVSISGTAGDSAKAASDKLKDFRADVREKANNYKTTYLEQWQDKYEEYYWNKKDSRYVQAKKSTIPPYNRSSAYGYEWKSGEPTGLRKKAKEDLETACNDLAGLTANIRYVPGVKADKLKSKFSSLNTFFDNFEDNGKAENFDKLLDDAFKDTSIEMATYKDKAKGDEEYKAFVVKVDGQQVPLSDAVNAFFTEYGAASTAAVAYASAHGGKIDDDELNKILSNMHDEYSKMLGSGSRIFNVASKEQQEALYQWLKEKNNLTDWPKTLDDLGDAMRKGDNKSLWPVFGNDTYGDYLRGLTGGSEGDEKTRNLAFAIGALTVGIGAGEASPKPEGPEDKEKEEKPWSGGTGPGGSNNGGSNNGGGGKFKTPDTEVDKDKSDKGEKGDDKTPDLTDRIKDKLPSPLTEIKKDYDALAREKFDEQFKTEEEYAEYVMKVNEEFESLTPEQLSGKLKEYGYDESEIQYLLQPENKDVAATAYASGKLNADLTTRANELAKADNVKDFDTKYDDPIDRTNDNESDTSSYAYLRDGDLNANVSPVNYNKDVKAAKETWTKSQETYTTAATKANAAIEKANSQAAELEKLQKQYGKDTSKWKEAEIKKYNETVDKYNKAVTEAISANKEATTAKASMDKAQEAYTKQYNDYQDKIKKEARDAYAQGRQNNNNNGNPSDSSDASNVTDTTPTGEIDPVTINSDGSISI